MSEIGDPEMSTAIRKIYKALEAGDVDAPKEAGRYAEDNNGFKESAAEIVAYDVEGQKAFVINSEQSTVDVLDLSSPEDPELFTSIDATFFWTEAGGINSVAVSDSKVALAVQNSDKQANGRMILLDADTFAELAVVEVGALPDMVTLLPAVISLLTVPRLLTSTCGSPFPVSAIPCRIRLPPSTQSIVFLP
jgi:hypothetical protein